MKHLKIMGVYDPATKLVDLSVIEQSHYAHAFGSLKDGQPSYRFLGTTCDIRSFENGVEYYKRPNIFYISSTPGCTEVAKGLTVEEFNKIKQAVIEYNEYFKD